MLLIRRLVFAAALALPLMGTPPDAHSAEDGLTVTGQVSLPPAAQRKAAPKRGQGFVPRAKNPLRPPDGHDPRYKMVVVLEGGPIDEVDRKPRSSRYDIIGENFASEMLPVVVGGKVEIRNQGQRSPRLYSTASDDVIPSDPINSKGIRSTKAISEKYKPIDIRDHDAKHFLAHVVAFEHAYFSVLGFDGSFEIKGVPAGTWNIKVWYRDSWVTNLPATTVTVSGKRAPKAVKLSLPAKLTTASQAKPERLPSTDK
jgi:hypothetical protein